MLYDNMIELEVASPHHHEEIQVCGTVGGVFLRKLLSYIVES